MTKQAIQDGFEKLRPGTELETSRRRPARAARPTGSSGMNATRAATLRGRAWVGGVVSLGRVQTPTLAMMVKREREIQAFTPEPYWLVHATFDPRYAGLWFEGDETRIFGDAERAPAIAEKVKGKDGVVESVERKEQKEIAPLLYDLTSLQRDANRRFGFSRPPHAPGRAEPLRGQEGDHLPAYELALPLRRHGPAAQADRRDAAADPGLRSTAARFVLDLAELPLGRVVNDARVTDHHAIIPTDVEHDLDDFSPDERRVFDLVAKRFLAVFHPPARYQRTTVITVVEEERFRTRGKITLEPGWRGVYGLESEEEKIARQEEEGVDDSTAEIPPLEQGQTVRCVEAEVESKETKPPPRYTEATLLSAMETAGKLIDDEELREAMKESGLGTPATRAETIEALIRREYIERVGKDLQPTPKGLQVITMLEEHKITSPELTGRLGAPPRPRSSTARATGVAFMADVAGFTDEIVKQIAALDKEKLRPVRVELGPCPRCGAEIGRDHQGELARLRLHELEEPRGGRLRLRDLEKGRRPDADAGNCAPAA